MISHSSAHHLANRLHSQYRKTDCLSIVTILVIVVVAESTTERMNMSPAKGIAQRLQAAYDKLLMIFALLEVDEIENGYMADGWSPKSLMAHIAFWDDYQTRRMQAAVDGLSAANGFPAATLSNDERAQLDGTRSWSTILAEADDARQRMIEFTEQLDETALAAVYPEGDHTLSLDDLLEHMVRHTRLHAQDLNNYCGSMERWSQQALRRFLITQHENLMDSISYLSEATIGETVVCGEWTIRDVLVHVLSWNEYEYSVLQQWPDAAHESLTPWLDGNGVDDINANLLAARAEMNMIDICDALMTYHRRVLRHFDNADSKQLAALGDHGWGERGTLSSFFYSFALHEAEHAGDIWHYRAETAQ